MLYMLQNKTKNKKQKFFFSLSLSFKQQPTFYFIAVNSGNLTKAFFPMQETSDMRSLFLRLYVCSFVCLSVCSFVYFFVCLLVSLFVCFVCLLVGIFRCFVSSFVWRHFKMFCLSVCLFVCLPVCLFVCMLVCLSVCSSFFRSRKQKFLSAAIIYHLSRGNPEKPEKPRKKTENPPKTEKSQINLFLESVYLQRKTNL
jgi:hypothetical protein